MCIFNIFCFRHLDSRQLFVILSTSLNNFPTFRLLALPLPPLAFNINIKSHRTAALPNSTTTMTLKAILLALGPLATALVPPCLPELGPQFCPGTAEASLIIQNDECTQDRMHSPTIYPEMTQQSLLKDEIFPLLVCSSYLMVRGPNANAVMAFV